MTRPTPPLPVLVCLCLCAGVGLASAQQSSFDDFRNLGLLEDRRREPSPLSIAGHTLDPAFNLKLGGIATPHAFAAASSGYNDNVLRGDHEAPGVRLRREAYGRLEAGLRLDTELSDHRLELSYNAAVLEYADSGDLDNLTQSARARLDLYAVDVEGHVNAGWQRTIFPQSIQLTGLVRLDTYQAAAYVEGRLGKVGLRLGGSFARLEYQNRQLQTLDQRNYRADVQFYGRITPKLRALGEYNVFLVVYDEGRSGNLNDYLVHQARIGIDGRLFPKLSTSLKVGAAFQDVDVTFGRDRREFTGFVAEVSAGYSPVEGTNLTASYARTLQPSNQSNFLINDEVRFEVGQSITPKVNASAFVRYNRGEVSRLNRIRAHINRYTAGASIQWRIKGWLSLRAGYEFTNLISPFLNSDYRIHIATASIAVGL
ncbi:MAG TPA: hypothetical protein DEA08_30520 [Planctomycetes bacterium]|nr:hypothetical protein [Planctomycetota bacterium]